MKHYHLVKLFRHFLLWLFILPLAFSACQDEDVSCVTNAFDTVRINFLKLDESTTRLVDTLYLVSIQAQNGFVFDEYTDTALTRLELPLNPSADEAVFFLQWREDTLAPLQQDTLVIRYGREQRLISPECGVEQRFVNLTSPSRVADSLRIVNAEVEVFTNPNISLYTCQYNFTDFIRARFLRRDTTRLDPVVTQLVSDTLVVSRITDSFGNVILDEQDTITNLRLPVNLNATSTTFFFDIVTESQETVSRQVEVFYVVDMIRFFECQPQIRVSDLDVLPNGHTFRNAVVENNVLNRSNLRNLDLYF